MTLFNKYSFNDDIRIFTLGTTYTSGRWMLAILGNIVVRLTGVYHVSLPLFNGILTILFIALICFLISVLFEIKSTWLNIGLTGMMVTFPTITGVMGFAFTAPYYLFGMLMGVSGVFLVCKYPKWYFYLGGVLLMACSVGVYQATIPICVSVFLLYLIKIVVERDELGWKKFLGLCMYYAAACIGFLVTYAGINKFILWRLQLELSSYRGISTFGKTSLEGYFQRIVWAYKEFFDPADGVSRNMYPFSMEKYYKLTIIIAILLTMYIVYKTFKKDISRGIQLALLVMLIPLAVNFIYVMCSVSVIHTLMTYGQVFFFVYFTWVADYIKPASIRVRQAAVGVTALFLLLMDLLYCRFANICYLKAEFMQEQAISYFTALATQIKSVEGYTDETPVAYIMESEVKEDVTITKLGVFDEVEIIPYNLSSIITDDGSWSLFMSMWCGFTPLTVDAAAYEQLPEVTRMPCYSDDGSIQMVDDVIVVKF